MNNDDLENRMVLPTSNPEDEPPSDPEERDPDEAYDEMRQREADDDHGRYNAAFDSFCETLEPFQIDYTFRNLLRSAFFKGAEFGINEFYRDYKTRVKDETP